MARYCKQGSLERWEQRNKGKPGGLKRKMMKVLGSARKKNKKKQ